MIDFTKIQTFDVAPDINVLRNANKALFQQNETLIKGICYALLGGVIYFTIKTIIKIQKENELSGSQEKNQGNN